MKCCVSIDFEDFSHDLERAVGVKRPRTRGPALVKAYERITRIFDESPGARRLTFFCTGQVAKDHAEIVARIAADGHEIACHSLYHDRVSSMERAEFGESLELAIGTLSAASGQPVRGYRAPAFTVPHKDHWAYEEIASRFVYDSSFVTARREDASRPFDVFTYGNHRLIEFPLYGRRLGPFRNFRVIGGTYLKLLPTRMILRLMRQAAAKGFLPIVYLHPYEFLHNGEFWVRPKDFAEVSFRDRAYYQLRQHQWLSVGNRGVARKLRSILREFEHVGTMHDQVPHDAPASAASSEMIA